MGGGGAGAGLGAADLDGDDGDTAPGGPVGGEEEGAAVLEALHVCGDGAHLGAFGEVGDEVGGLQIGLVAGGGPVGEADAEFLEGEDGAALVAGLGDQGDRRAVQVVAEALEGVEVGVGAEQPQTVGAGHGGGQPLLRGGALRAGLGETGGEGDGELHLGLGQFVDQGRGSETSRTARSTCSGRSATEGAQGMPKTDSRVGCTGWSRAPTRSDQASSCRVIPVFGRPSVSEAPTTATDSGRKKRSRSGTSAYSGRPLTSRSCGLGGPAVHGLCGVLAARDGPGPAGVGGEGAVG